MKEKEWSIKYTIVAIDISGIDVIFQAYQILVLRMVYTEKKKRANMAYYWAERLSLIYHFRRRICYFTFFRETSIFSDVHFFRQFVQRLRIHAT